MIIKNSFTKFFLAGLLIVSNVVELASGVPLASAVDCSSMALTMADCLSYLTTGSTVEQPEGNCCSGLKTVIKTDAECLCQGFKNSAQLGISLNVSKALTLPSACHVSASSFSDCGLSVRIIGAPDVSPTGSPPSSNPPAPPTVPAASAEVAHAPPPGSSGSSAIAASVGWLVLVLIAAIFSLS